MKWFFWLIGTIFYLYQFVFRTLFSTLGYDITQKFQISVADLSTFFAAGMLAYPLMQIPAGILLDRFGPRKMLTIAMGCLSLGILLVSWTNSFALAIFGRVLMGAGSAFGFIGTSKIATSWFPLKMMGFLLGFTVFLGSMGGAFSKYLYEALPSHWDLNHSLLNMGLFGAGLALVIAIFLKDKSSPNLSTNRQKVVKTTTFLQDLRTIFTHKQIMFAALFTFFGYLPISIIGDSWGTIAFEKMFHVDKSIAENTLIYFYVAFAIGAFFYSSLANTLRKIRYVLLVEYGLAVLFMYILFMHPEVGSSNFFGIPGFLLLSSAIGFNLGGVSLAFPIGCSHAPEQISATIVGVMNTLCMVSGGIFSKLIGTLLHYYWDGKLNSDGLPVFSALAFQSALKPLLLTTMLAFILLFFIQPGDEEQGQKVATKNTQKKSASNNVMRSSPSQVPT